MGAERQKNILGILTRLVGNKESDRISQAIRKFHLHLKCTKLQK